VAEIYEICISLRDLYISLGICISLAICISSYESLSVAEMCERSSLFAFRPPKSHATLKLP